MARGVAHTQLPSSGLATGLTDAMGAMGATDAAGQCRCDVHDCVDWTAKCHGSFGRNKINECD